MEIVGIDFLLLLFLIILKGAIVNGQFRLFCNTVIGENGYLSVIYFATLLTFCIFTTRFGVAKILAFGNAKMKICIFFCHSSHFSYLCKNILLFAVFITDSICV